MATQMPKKIVVFLANPLLGVRLYVYGGRSMASLILQSLARLHSEESGQGLVEYLLLLALVAFAAVTGMQSLATGINTAFNAMSTRMSTYIS